MFSGLEPGRTANDVLRDAGLVADPAEVLDPAANVTLTVWWKT